MAYLSLSLLGPLQIVRAGAPISSFTYQKVPALRVYLAVEAGRPHEREALVGLLWPNLPDAAARTNLRQALAKLREALGDDTAAPPLLLTTRETVQFNPASDYELDVDTFAASLDECHRHRHRGLDRCPVCAARLAQAAALYRGNFLAEFSLADSAPFEEWAIVKREQLHRRAQAAFGALAAAHERRGDYAQAQHFARRQIERDPWREEAHRQLMRALALAGERSAALAQFEACRLALADGLSALPASETLALYEQIRSGQPGPAPASAPRLTWPHPATALIGRESDLAHLADRLSDPECRLLTLAGPGGIGKTRLALAAAAEHAWTYAHGTAFVELAPLPSAGLLTSALAQAVGLPLAGLADPLDELLLALGDRELLIVLDNFEHLLPDNESERTAVGWLAQVLARLPRAQCLVTSRERLSLPGEWLFTVAGLPFPPTGAEPAQAFSAVQLFVTCARRVQPEFSLAESELPVVARICRLVDGMPLALELAAAWVRVLTCAEIAAEIERGLGILAAASQPAAERHRSLRVVFDHSWRLLTAPEQRAFQCLAVFRGGFEREAAEVVARVTLPLLSALADKSLVQRRGARRFDLHTLSQQYARERLHAAGEAEAAGDRQAAYFLDLAERGLAALRGPEQPAWLERLSAEFDNLRAALEWTASRDPDAYLRLSGALWRFWHMRGHLREGQQWLERALAHPVPSAARARALRGAADLAWQQGDFGQARAWAEASVALWRTLNQPASLGEALTILGMAAGYQGDHAAAEAALDESVALFRAHADDWGLALALFHSADSEAVPRPPSAARQRLMESLDLFRQSGDRWGQALPLHGLGFTAYQQGDYPAARRWLADALALRREIGDRWLTAQTLNILGEVARCEGAYRRAAAYYEESLALYRALDSPGRVAMALHNLAYSAHHRNNDQRARILFADSLAAFQALGDHWGLAACLEGLAAVHPDGATAARLFGAAEAQREAMHTHRMPADRLEYERSLTALRARLVETDFETAWNDGRALPLEQAIAQAVASAMI